MELNEGIMIVAVDDDRYDLDQLREAVRPLNGVDMVCFDDLDTGIRFFRDAECDLFLVDYYLPSYQGTESIRKLHHELGAHVPIIVIADREDSELYKDAISAGAQDCISKRDLTSGQLLRVTRNATERQKLQDQLRRSARTDFVTGIPNRCAMIDEINSRLRTENPFNLLLMELDDFKLINQGYGHEVGDALLRRFADLLFELIRPIDHIARFGGDEFVVLLDGDQSDEKIDDYVASLFSIIESGFEIFDTKLLVSISVGIAKSKGFLGDSTTLLRDADTAKCRAKERGKSTCARFDLEMKNEAVERLDLERGVRQAIDNEELDLHYQPIFDLNTFKVIGCEALLRWRRGTGHVGTEELIAVAEHIGAIHELGRWVVRTAARQAAQWMAIQPDLVMHVNVSPTQLRTSEFARIACETVKELGVPFQQIVLEITESCDFVDQASAVEQVQFLKEQGFRIALDDFGKGYSTLGHLHQLPIDEVKIDKSFIAGLDDSSSSESTSYCTAFVSAIKVLAQSIGLDMVAEGVETQRQVELLRETGYVQAQGYLYAKPMPAHAMRRLLISEKRKNKKTSTDTMPPEESLCVQQLPRSASEFQSKTLAT